MINEKLEVLITIDIYLDNLECEIDRIASDFNSGNEAVGISKIVPLAEGIDYISKAINLTKDVQKEEIVLDDLNEILNQIIDTLENEDYVLIGDLFYYELLPIIEDIHNKIKKSI